MLHVAAAHSKDEIVKLLARKTDPNLAGGVRFSTFTPSLIQHVFVFIIKVYLTISDLIYHLNYSSNSLFYCY